MHSTLPNLATSKLIIIPSTTFPSTKTARNQWPPPTPKSRHASRGPRSPTLRRSQKPSPVRWFSIAIDQLLGGMVIHPGILSYLSWNRRPLDWSAQIAKHLGSSMRKRKHSKGQISCKPWMHEPPAGLIMVTSNSPFSGDPSVAPAVSRPTEGPPQWGHASSALNKKKRCVWEFATPEITIIRDVTIKHMYGFNEWKIDGMDGFVWDLEVYPQIRQF